MRLKNSLLLRIFGITAVAIYVSSCTSIPTEDPALRYASNDRAYILDTHMNAAKFASRLKARGIKVIGRYYARRKQSDLGQKILANQTHNGRPEVDVLLENGFSILSIYQYRSSSRNKFVYGLRDTGSAKKEAEADARAALAQARKVGQPKESAIYFGVDFNLKNSDERGKRAVVAYFKTLRRVIGDNYKLGVYGNGVTLRLLTRVEKSGDSTKVKKPLVDYTWVSPSVSYDQTVDYFNELDKKGNQKWTLIQHQVDRFSYGRPNKCPDWGRWHSYDLNVQNPAMKDAGFWGNADLGRRQAKAVFNARRFSNSNRAYVRRAPDERASLIKKRRCRLVTALDKNGKKIYKSNGDEKKVWKWLNERVVLRSRSVRVREAKNAPDWFEVDIDDDTIFDGFMLKSSLSDSLKQMPSYRR